MMAALDVESSRFCNSLFNRSTNCILEISEAFIVYLKPTSHSHSLPFYQNERMQQPLAHLYFLTLLEHLQAHGQEYKLSGLIRIANTIIQQCASDTTKEVESVVLWIELQAVVQVILQKLAVHLNPSEPHMEEVHPVVDDINR